MILVRLPLRMRPIMSPRSCIACLVLHHFPLLWLPVPTSRRWLLPLSPLAFCHLQVFDNALQCLSKEDQKIPALQYMLRLLRSGIGVHHGGLLPLLKELIELLFQEQLIKVGRGCDSCGQLFAALSKLEGAQLAGPSVRTDPCEC